MLRAALFFILFSSALQPLKVAIPVDLLTNFRVDNNPFSDKLSFTFQLVRSSTVRLEIYDELGRQLFGDDLGYRNLGEFAYSLDVPSSWQHGIYYARLIAGGEVHTVKLVRQ